jgi:hypothetical protein
VSPAELTPTATCSARDLELIDAYWRAANYLSVGQIYLLGNPLLREPLLAEHVKPRLLGHWGTTPGLNLLYAHMNRVISERGLNALYVTGRRWPGGRPGGPRRLHPPAGIDVLAFTGGVGENSPGVRRRAADRVAFLGVAIDTHRNDTARNDRDITAAGAMVRTLVITAREDLQIAREARRVCDTRDAGSASGQVGS